MKGSDRAMIVQLALLLERGGVVTARSYGERVGVHRRTVTRWLADIEAVLPLDVQEHGTGKYRTVEYRRLA